MSRAPLQLWNRAKELIISQYKDSSNLNLLLENIIGTFQDLENANAFLSGSFDVSTANGTWLDIIGKIKNISRESGETDTSYRQRLISGFKIKNAGTADYAITCAAEASGDISPVVFDEVDATFFIYTPNGRQLMRSTAQKFSPAGVLGVPAAAIVLANGKKIETAGEKKVLGVAIEKNVFTGSSVIITSAGSKVITSQDKYILAKEED